MSNNYKKIFSESIDSLFKTLKSTQNVDKAKSWLNRNQYRIENLFRYDTIRDFVFEPIKDVFHVPGYGQDKTARSIITQVAVVNAVIAGLPGSLGVGVYVSIALEFWMAYSLSRAVGLTLSRDEVMDTIVAWAIGAGSILLLFKEALNLVFPIITSLMPFAGPGTALTQLVVTNLFGVVLWIAFEELKTKRKFKFPMTSSKRLYDELVFLLKHQWSAGIPLVNPSNWLIMGKRLYNWFMGNVSNDMTDLRGELMPTVAMAWLLSREYDKLSGPIGDEFIQAIKDRYPDLADASFVEISDHMSSYTSEELVGVINLVKGKLFERLVEKYENNDDDNWSAALHEDEFYPGSDMNLFNDKGEIIEVSLKASSNTQYLEQSLLKYPDFPIIATDEVADAMKNNDFIWASGITNEELTTITEENLEYMMNRLDSVSAVDVTTTGVVTKAMMSLWPFVIAYLRKRIDSKQLEQVCEHVFPEFGNSLASRLSYSVALGPVFAWWLLARGVLSLTKQGSNNKHQVIGRLMVK